MQKARRLACSTASVSSPSNTSVAFRGRSRTSSAGGDYVKASKLNTPSDRFKSKFRLRKRNNKARLSSKNNKKAKKTPKAGQSQRPTFGSLQNTVVLAPFHTLKKCFQTKLVDLYLNEKIKKNNHKTKMAEKQNMLFEYDVMELKPLEQEDTKKETKGSKVKKGNVRFKDKEPRSKRNRSKSEKSQSYCQCDKTNASKSKEQKTNPPKKSRSRNQATKPEKRSLQASLVPNNFQLAFPISGPEESKRRRLNSPRLTSLPTGPAYGIVPNLLELSRASCSELKSETNLSYSNVSSSSKIDSWETISDSPSYRIFEGSLAISTTSFDSCLEPYEKDSCNCSERSDIRNKSSRTNSRYNTRLKALKEKSGRSSHVADFVVNLEDDESGQYIMNEEVGNSDGQIIDFLDREPQSQVIPSDETTQHLQPLRQQKSKSQTRKSNHENDSGKAYFLRSQVGSKERVKTNDIEGQTFLGEYRNDGELESRPLATASGAQEEKGGVEREDNNFEPLEDAREGNLPTKDKTSFQSQAKLSQPLSELSSSKTDNTTNCSNVSVTDDAVKTCSSQKETSLNLNVGDEPPCETLHKRRTDTTTDEQVDSVTDKSPEVNESGFGSEGRAGEEPKLVEDLGNQLVELLPPPETINHFQESSNVDRHVAHQPQDKEPSFIFGPRTMSDRLGESCEFSFGLNWVFSDDDNSEHGDHFL